jgi:hypothetical protein
LKLMSVVIADFHNDDDLQASKRLLEKKEK